MAGKYKNNIRKDKRGGYSYKIIEDNFRRLRDVRITYTLGASHLLGMKFPQYVSKEIQHFATS